MSRINKTEAEKAVVKSVSFEIDTLLKAIDKSKSKFRGNLSFYINELIERDTEDITINDDVRVEFVNELKNKAEEKKRKQAEKELEKELEKEKANEVKKSEVVSVKEVNVEEPIKAPVFKKNSMRLSMIDSVIDLGEE